MNFSPTRTAALLAVYLALCCALEDEESSHLLLLQLLLRVKVLWIVNQKGFNVVNSKPDLLILQPLIHSVFYHVTVICGLSILIISLIAAANIQPSVTGKFLHFNTYQLINAQVAMWWLRLKEDKMFREYVKMM